MKSMAKRANELVERIKPILAGENPQVQGGVLADLLSLFIAGHTPQIRDEILKLHFEAVRKLVPLSEKELFGERGHPGAEANV